MANEAIRELLGLSEAQFIKTQKAAKDLVESGLCITIKEAIELMKKAILGL